MSINKMLATAPLGTLSTKGSVRFSQELEGMCLIGMAMCLKMEVGVCIGAISCHFVSKQSEIEAVKSKDYIIRGLDQSCG